MVSHWQTWGPLNERRLGTKIKSISTNTSKVEKSSCKAYYHSYRDFPREGKHGQQQRPWRQRASPDPPAKPLYPGLAHQAAVLGAVESDPITRAAAGPQDRLQRCNLPTRGGRLSWVCAPRT